MLPHACCAAWGNGCCLLTSLRLFLVVLFWLEHTLMCRNYWFFVLIAACHAVACLQIARLVRICCHVYVSCSLACGCQLAESALDLVATVVGRVRPHILSCVLCQRPSSLRSWELCAAMRTRCTWICLSLRLQITDPLSQKMGVHCKWFASTATGH